MAVTNWIIDKSACTRLSASRDVTAWIERIERGLVRISTVTRLEIGYSFRTGQQAREETASPPLSLMPVEYLTPAAEDRAVGPPPRPAAVPTTPTAVGRWTLPRRLPTRSTRPAPWWCAKASARGERRRAAVVPGRNRGQRKPRRRAVPCAGRRSGRRATRERRYRRPG